MWGRSAVCRTGHSSGCMIPGEGAIDRQAHREIAGAAAERLKGGLPGKLQRHKHKAEEVKPQQRDDGKRLLTDRN